MAKRKMPTRETEDFFEDIKPKKVDPELIKVRVSGTKRLNVRKEPSLDSEILMVIPEGSLALVDSYDEKWYHTHLELENGEEADAYFVKLFAKRV